jgi:hypothetical protein
MGDACCGARLGASLQARPPVKVVKTEIILPLGATSDVDSEVIVLGVLDHVTAPQMVSFLKSK